MRWISFIILFWCICYTTPESHAQSAFPISGNVADTLNGARLTHASVVLVRLKDTTLATFTRTDDGGNFSTNPVPPGSYRLLITYPGFADYTDRITVANEPLALSSIPMTTSEHLLHEFVITKKSAAMIIRGDTTEYNADSFHVQGGATVEDLLKKLPGLQVDKDGKITAQGEQVQKILVDGEEFFSDDPAVVTKNLQAAVLDKVQVYDKKSDAATFSGIDDGERTKTINLQLKENMKKGLFGKAVVGAGPSLATDAGIRGGFFENQAMINLFRGKQQFSAFGIVSNTGTMGLSWHDAGRYGSGSDGGTYDEESGIYFTGGDEDDDIAGGEYTGEGLPTAQTGGLHYADKFGDKDAQHISANYRFAKNNVAAEGTTITQYILPDSGYVRTEHRNTYTTSMRHGGDALYEWTIDTSSNMKLTVNGGATERTSSGNYSTDTRGMSGSLINTSNRISTSTTNAQTLNADLSYRKKFHKAGRNASVEVRETYRASDGAGYLNAGDQYYTDGLQTGADTLDQQKKNSGLTLALNTKLSYTEPLSKKLFLTGRYGLTSATNAAERLSYNRGASGEWSDMPDSLYSSSYTYNVLTQDGGLALRYVDKKWNVSLGANAFHTQWAQHDRLWATPDRDRVYNNYSPTTSLRYNFSKFTYLTANYSGATHQPTLDQLQPLRQNTDPLNISVGNPDLRQEFRNDIRVFYHSAKPISSRYIYVSGNASLTNDAITRSDNFDALGRRVSQYVNVNGNYNANLYAGYWTKWRWLNADVGGSLNSGAGHATTFVNSLQNESNTTSYGMSLSLYKTWRKGDKDIASVTLQPGITYTDNHASISTFTQSYYTGETTAEGYVQTFWKIILRSSVWYNYRQKTAIFTSNNNVVRWNIELSRKFLKGDALEARISVRDILDQNIGYSRNASDNYIVENRYNTIRRYALLSFSWNIAKGPDAKLKTGSDNDD